MLVKNLKWHDLSPNVKVNDVVELNDKDWPLHYRVGVVRGVEQQKGVAGFGQIEIDSAVDPPGLREVMVVTR